MSDVVSVRKNIVANFAGSAWSGVMGLVFIPLYIRYLGMEAYGLIGVFAVMQTWASLLDMGIAPTLNREMARFTAGAHSAQSIHDLLRSLEAICLCLAVCVVLGIWAGAGRLANGWLRIESLRPDVVVTALTIMSAVVAFRFCEGLYRGSLFGLQRQVWYNAAQALLATLKFGGAAFCLAYISPTIEAFFIWQAAVSFFTVIIYAVQLRRVLPAAPLRPRLSVKAISGVWVFAGGMAGTNLLALLLTQADKMLLSHLISLEFFGYYALATSMVSIVAMVAIPVAQAVYPHMVELLALEDRSGLAMVYHQSAQLVTVLTAPISLLLALFAGGIVYMWSGDVKLAENTAPILSVLVVGNYLYGLMFIPYMLQLADGWTGLSVKTNVVAVLVLIPTIFWIVPIYGAVGAAWIWVILNAGYVLIAIQFMHRRLLSAEKVRWYISDVLLPFCGAMGVTFLAQLIRPEGYHDRMHWFFFLLVVGGLSVTASMVLASRIRPLLVSSVLRTVKLIYG